MSQYPSEIFYVSLSSGPWLNPCWGHAGWWCRLCLRKKMNKNFPLTQTTKSAQDSTWHSRWNAPQICWNYFAYPFWGRANGKHFEGGGLFTKKKKTMLIVSITNEKDQSEIFLCQLSELATGLVFVRGAVFFATTLLQGLHTTILTKALPRQVYGQNVKMSFPPRKNPPVTLFVLFQMR